MRYRILTVSDIAFKYPVSVTRARPIVRGQIREATLALNQKEAQMMNRYIQATKAAREALEPHPSWKREELRAKALIAIRDACGGTPGTDAVYDDAERTLGIKST